MVKRHIYWLILILIAACQPGPPPATAPPITPFPTVTPGWEVRGLVPTAAFVPVVADGDGFAPAEAAALGAEPTATPDYSQCPEVDDESELPRRQPDTHADIADTLARYLSEGGNPAELADTLADEWDILGENGYVQDETDFNRSGEPEVIVGYVLEESTGGLLIFGCIEGRYTILHQMTSDTPDVPQLLGVQDMNRDFRDDLLVAGGRCDEAGTCQFATQMLTWQPQTGRFINLIGTTILSDDLPAINDTDEDMVSEIIVPLENIGTLATGPLRTGLHIYDWNGSVYTLSIIQLDRPRYRVQFVHQADRAFAQVDMEDAVTLYETALTEDGLRYWFNDGPVVLRSYNIYRLLLTYAFLNDERAGELYDLLNAEYPIEPDSSLEDLTVYAHLSYIFWDTFLASENLHSACLDVQDIIEDRPEALQLLNRYGSRNPKYTAIELCPF